MKLFEGNEVTFSSNLFKQKWKNATSDKMSCYEDATLIGILEPGDILVRDADGEYSIVHRLDGIK